MTLETFIEKFDTFADAPDAVAKMRELALRLAFEGGSSATQLERRPGKWPTKTIGEISTELTPGFACGKSNQMQDGHVHLRTHNISTLGSLNFDLHIQVDPRKVDSKKNSIKKGDILFNNTNSQELVGKTALVDKDYPYGFSNHLTRIRLKDHAFPPFVVYYFKLLRDSGYFASICTRWINQAGINTKLLEKQLIPLPPIAEQKRIVAKVDELMALCDRLEAQQKERDSRATALARASLSRFADAPTPANLNLLFQNSYHIPPADLRKSILTLAVQGKLVPQDPTDEPAETLVRRTNSQSERLGTTNNESCLKSLPIIENSDWRITIPGEWSTESIGEIADDVTPGFACGKSNQMRGGHVHLRTHNISTLGSLNFDLIIEIDPEKVDPNKNSIKKGDILFNNTNSQELVGKTALADKDYPYGFSNHLTRIRLKDHVLPSFVVYYFKLLRDSGYFAKICTRWINQAGINIKSLEKQLIPVPPLSEQRRIVAKLDQLMALTDALESQLSESKAYAHNLLDAMVTELTVI